MANPLAPRPGSVHDLIVAVDAGGTGIVRSDGTLCRPLARVPHAPGARILSRVLARLAAAGRPRRALLTVFAGAPYAEGVDPVVQVLEGVCDAWHVPLVWLPDLRTVLDALRELGVHADARDAPPSIH